MAELFARSREHGADIIVAEDEGLAGFVLFDPARKWLEQIAVHPRAQGAGVARLLVGHVKKACPEGVALSVNTDNARALAFYRREGFTLDGEGSNPLSGLPTRRLRWAPDLTPRPAPPPRR
nr:GNAT family N-acetyltransferase [Rhodoblastus sphagnicola]